MPVPLLCKRFRLMGMLGPMMLLVFGLVGAGLFSALFVTYLCHSYLHVLSESAAGVIESRWPDETILEWWWKPCYFVALLAFWAPLGAIVLGPFFLQNPPGFFIAFAIFLWFAYPLSLVSALSAGSAFVVLSPPVVGRLLLHGRALLALQLVTLPPMALGVGCVVLMFTHNLLWIIPAVLVLPGALLLHARAWGRVTWLATVERSSPERPKLAPSHSAALAVEDPWQVEPPAVPELDVEVVDEPPAEDVEEDEWSPYKRPYDLGPEHERERPQLSEYYKHRARKERQRQRVAAGRRSLERVTAKQPATLGRALGRRLFGYLFYEPTLRAWLGLSALQLIALLFLALVAVFLPEVL